jgi:ABC-2 type transport system ATP-binding protein
VVTIKSPDTGKIAAAFAVPWINRIETHDGEVILTLQNAEQHLSMIVTRLNDEQIPITSISVHKPTLEDVFLSFTGKTIREEDISRKDAMRMHFRMMRH